MAISLSKSGDIQGIHLVGASGARLGTIRELFIDLATGQTEFLIVDAGGLLGGSGKFHPVPWSNVHFDPITKAFSTAMSKDQFKDAPSYDREQLGNASYGWSEQAARYFAPQPATPRGEP